METKNMREKAERAEIDTRRIKNAKDIRQDTKKSKKKIKLN